ncbi:MAG: DUF4340 domain-containing protein [Bacteroidota bacterium]
MYRKISIIVILAGLLVLMGIYFLTKFTGSNDSPLKEKILTINPELVTRVQVYDHQAGDEVEIVHKDGAWKLLSKGKEYNGSPEAIGNALVMLNRLPTESIAATKSKKWEEFKVDEDQALHIEIFEGDKQTGDVYVGKFDFVQIPATEPGKQPQTRMTSYVRSADDDRVYAVNGILRSNFQGGITPFRNRTLFYTREPLTDISRISISGPEGDAMLDLSGKWALNGTAVDSIKTDRYLRGLARLRSSHFVDDVDIISLESVYTIKIEGESFSPVSLSAYAADSTIQYYITSSANPGAIFNGAKGNTFEKIFEVAEALLPE